MRLNIEDIPEFVLRKFKDDPDGIKRRIERNLAKFIRVFNVDEKVSFQEVRDEMPYNDVLEMRARRKAYALPETSPGLRISSQVAESLGFPKSAS